VALPAATRWVLYGWRVIFGFDGALVATQRQPPDRGRRSPGGSANLVPGGENDPRRVSSL